MKDNADFIDHLVSLADPEKDRGPIAILRRAASGEARDLAKLYPLVLPWVVRADAEAAYIQTACLFGIYPTKPSDHSRGMSLGQAMRRHFLDTGSRPSVEDRFVALLRCHRDELLDHLRHAVNLVKDTKLPLRWTDVLYALQRWDESEETFQDHPRRLWARDFWGFSRPQGTANSGEPSPSIGAAQ